MNNALQIICQFCDKPMEFVRDDAKNIDAVCECGSVFHIYEPNCGYRLACLPSDTISPDEKLWRAERALELLDTIYPVKVHQAKEIVAKFEYDSTMGQEMLDMANGIEKMKS